MVRLPASGMRDEQVRTVAYFSLQATQASEVEKTGSGVTGVGEGAGTTGPMVVVSGGSSGASVVVGGAGSSSCADTKVDKKNTATMKARTSSRLEGCLFGVKTICSFE